MDRHSCESRACMLVPAFMLVAMVFAGDADAKNPKRLARPTELSCIELVEPAAYSGRHGIPRVEYTTRLERGPYWSERVDEKGTYYRGPPGAFSFRDNQGRISPGGVDALDGGLYVPNDRSKFPTPYVYLSMSAAPVEVPAEGAGCVDPRIPKEAFAEARYMRVNATVSGDGLSHGDEAALGAGGSLAGGLVVNLITKGVVGRIAPAHKLTDPALGARLRAAADNRIVFGPMTDFTDDTESER